MFALTKIFGPFADPGNLALAVLLAGSVLLFTRAARLGQALVVLVTAGLLTLAVLPLDGWLVAPLEDRIPPPAAVPDHVDGVIVLGGMIDPTISAVRGQVTLNGAAERLTAFVELARRYPGAKLVFSGGSGQLLDQQHKEADVARRFLAAMGLASERVIFEDQSRNTRENAVYSRTLAEPKAGEVWLLVTSAMHMPRALGSFRAAGWQVVPYPVDYTTTGGGGMLRFSLGAGLSNLGGAAHEWLGLAYYRLRGWSDSLFPSL